MRGDAPARFQELQSRMHVTDRGAIASHRTRHAGGADGVRHAARWKEVARRLSRGACGENISPRCSTRRDRTDALRLSDVADDGAAHARRSARHGWEGIIAKRADAPYDPGERSRAWLKLKIEQRQEFVVGGWTEPRKSREHIGAILLGYYDDDGQSRLCGTHGHGIHAAYACSSMSERLSRIERKKSPFTTTPRTNEPAHWVQPAIVVEIKFNEWTTDGNLRQPVFLGVRDDKAPRMSCASRNRQRERRARDASRTRGQDGARAISRRRQLDGRRSSRCVATARASRPRTPSAVASSSTRSSQRRRRRRAPSIFRRGTLEVSNLDKVFFPKTKHTKGDVMRFYAQLSPYLLPAIADRPLVMKRFPNGVSGKAFYQQKAPADPPRVRARRDRGG